MSRGIVKTIYSNRIGDSRFRRGCDSRISSFFGHIPAGGNEIHSLFFRDDIRTEYSQAIQGVAPSRASEDWPGRRAAQEGASAKDEHGDPTEEEQEDEEDGKENERDLRTEKMDRTMDLLQSKVLDTAAFDYVYHLNSKKVTEELREGVLELRQQLNDILEDYFGSAGLYLLLYASQFRDLFHHGMDVNFVIADSCNSISSIGALVDAFVSHGLDAMPLKKSRAPKIRIVGPVLTAEYKVCINQPMMEYNSNLIHAYAHIDD